MRSYAIPTEALLVAELRLVVLGAVVIGMVWLARKFMSFINQDESDRQTYLPVICIMTIVLTSGAPILSGISAWMLSPFTAPSPYLEWGISTIMAIPTAFFLATGAAGLIVRGRRDMQWLMELERAAYHKIMRETK